MANSPIKSKQYLIMIYQFALKILVAYSSYSMFPGNTTIMLFFNTFRRHFSWIFYVIDYPFNGYVWVGVYKYMSMSSWWLWYHSSFLVEMLSIFVVAVVFVVILTLQMSLWKLQSNSDTFQSDWNWRGTVSLVDNHFFLSARLHIVPYWNVNVAIKGTHI